MPRKCVLVAAGASNDRVFSHICYVAESLSLILPAFHFRYIRKSVESWEPWLKETCKIYNWTHTKSPLIWREIGLTHVNTTYIGGGYQFWEWLHEYYNIESRLNEEELNALHADFAFARELIRHKRLPLTVTESFRRVMVMGAGGTVCLDLVPQLIMMEELWSTHGTVVSLYDEPGCFFKLRRICYDSKGLGGGLHSVKILEEVPEGLIDCDVLIYLDSLGRDDNEGLNSWFRRNYEVIEQLSVEINEHAPNHMKVMFCSFGLTAFYVSVMHEIVTKIPKENIVAVSAHYALELIYPFVTELGYTTGSFGCPPVWGYLGISNFVDVHHMTQKCSIYQPNKRAVSANENTTLPLGTERSELRWFFYMSHNKNSSNLQTKRAALAQYQVGRSDDYQKCKAICDLLKLWYAKGKNIGDEIISLTIASDGSFGIPKGLAFSQPVSLKVLKDQSRVWTPFKDFPMPLMPFSIFQNLIDSALIINKRIAKFRAEKTNSVKE